VKEKTVAVIALNPESAATFADTLREAASWVALAAAQGAQLAVLPETINLLHRDHGNVPLEDWRNQTELLCETATRCGISLILPLLVREDGVLANRFYVLARNGSLLGHYQKRVPSFGEQAAGVVPGHTAPILWEGVKIGGGICIDVYYPRAVFDSQIDQGAEFFVVPSLTPGGAHLDYCAVEYGVPFVLAYPQWSRILDRDGSPLAEGGYRSETMRFGFGMPMLLATINFDAVTLFADFNQQKMRDVARHYGRDVRIRFDQSNCVFTLESRSADLTVPDIMREFGLISRRDHFAQNGPRP
jgi:predicted amidohydrolase